MSTRTPQELMTHLVRLDPEVSRVLWANFDPRFATPLSKALQDAKGTTRQAASLLLKRLVIQGLVKDKADTRPKLYEQPILMANTISVPIAGLEEHVVWGREFRPVFAQYMGEEALSVWEYGFTEMLNNARDHSEGTKVTITACIRAGGTSVSMEDDGEGIFKRITRICKLPDERQAILELAKGKLTTDPDNHSGEGVFFSSRAFDEFEILSGGLVFHHQDGKEDLLVERERESSGTVVWMAHGNHTQRQMKDVFDEFAEPDEYTFSKTVVPVKLARFGEEGLVSRSQAQRLLARVDRFKVVLFDFADVESVGQAFADEIFRVYAKAHPEVEIAPIHASEQIRNMISRAVAAR